MIQMTEEQIEEAVRTLQKFALDKTRRLKYASQDRERINAMIQAKMQPTGARVDFVTDMAHALIEHLRIAATDYNAKNPHDVCLIGDFTDVLLEAHRILMDKVRN